MIDQMVLANIMLDLFAIVLSLIPVVYTLNDQRYRQRLNQYFLGVSVSRLSGVRMFSYPSTTAE